MAERDDLVIAPTTGSATTADIRALAAMQSYGAGALSRIQARSDKWIAGLTAITGVLTTAIVIKGAETFTDLTGEVTVLGLTVEPAVIVVALMVLGGAALAYGLAKAYTAAHGDPFADDALAQRAREQEVTGAYAAWQSAMQDAAATARTNLKSAVRWTIVGTLLLAAAVVLTWTSPTQEATAVNTCFEVGPDTVKIRGAAPVVTSGSLTIVPC
ncbi:hypothetical protein [Serinicoccus sediminis]|uniref:hypothetical protein n=1 Tax=Serinicoccus sediminis TaxID=2306021 RepID=UPI0010226E01|nr:hypothetical protein [Serinicoccus sediminis]